VHRSYAHVGLTSNQFSPFLNSYVEPVPELVEEAFRLGVPRDILTIGVGESLPLADQSIDAVCEFAVLHHVERPERVVAEMMRVARKAIFLSDANRFGQGGRVARVIKLCVFKSGLGWAYRLLQTRGRGYLTSEGDGVFYSYSVFDSYQQLASWADRIVLVPTSSVSNHGWFSPLLTSGHVLLCAFREPDTAANVR
jgi:SAM-dependent methyltransferase